jgi:hypothetical protein
VRRGTSSSSFCCARAAAVGAHSAEADVALGGGGHDFLFIGALRQVGDGLYAGCDAGESDVWAEPREALRERVAPGSVLSSHASEVTVETTGRNKGRERELIEDQ